MTLYQTSSPTAAAAAMKIITQLFILTLSLLLVNANDADDQYCGNLIKDFKNNCTTSMVTINNCCDLKTFLASGVYKVSKGTFDEYASAYCDMLTDGGGWMVIQRNKKDSLVNFNKNWTDYEKGFGDLNTEFWYGLEEMHCLTQRGQWEMRLDFQLSNGTWTYLHYNQFSVGSANEKYPLTVGGYSGPVPSDNALTYNNMNFSTPDNDNDEWRGNCATSYKSGNWYNRCYSIDINQQPPIPYYSALYTEMKIRLKDCITQ